MLLVAVVLFVIITADAPYRFVQLNSVDIQMNGHMSKPIDFQTLYDTLKKWL